MWGRRRARLGPNLPRSLGRRLALLLVVVLVAVGFYYFGGRDEFRAPSEEPLPVTMTVAQEAALGLQAAALLTRQHGGLDPDEEGQALLQRVGKRLVDRSEAGKAPYSFTFHLLADPRTVDVFALPGGRVLMTAGLAARLRTEGEFAAVLAHAAAHIAAQHATRRLGQQVDDLPDAAAIAAFDPNDAAGDAQVAALVAQAAAVAFSPGDEAQADTLAAGFMDAAGYDPRALFGVLETLSRAAAGGNRPAFFDTHPPSDRRFERLRRVISSRYPDGVPEALVK